MSYKEDRELIKEIVTDMLGRSNDLEEWYIYHLTCRDGEIQELKHEIRELKKLIQP